MKTCRGVSLLVCVALVASGVSCAPAPAGRASSTAARAAAPSVEPPAPSERRDVDVTVEVRAPLRARYEPSLGGAPKPSLGVIVTNRSARPLDVADLRAHLEAVREGVSFRCAKEVGASSGDREPTTLAPGSSFVFERELDCALPLVGAYAVRVGVSFGSGAYRAPREVRTFGLTVTALPAVAPREIDALPGLWAAMGASGKLDGGVGRGPGRTLVMLVNSTAKAIELPPLHLSLRVYRVGHPIPCQDAPVVLGAPRVLSAGETYSEPVEVSCLGLSTPGSYDVVARLIVPGGSEGDREIALGKLHVDVVTDPSVVVPPQRHR